MTDIFHANPSPFHPVPGIALTNPRGLLLSALLALDVATWMHTAVHGLNLLTL